MATAVGEIRAAKRRHGLGYLVAGLVAILIGVAAWGWWRIRVCLPQLDGTARVEGLSAPVEVLRDARGMPHIRAQSVEDAYFAQGYVTSQDRLWQMDLSRRLAEGELSEVFGRLTLERDRENRALGLAEIAERSFQELPPDPARLLTAYTRGVNAFISTHLGRLPLEFALLRYQPRPWREADSIAVGLNMVKTLNSSWRIDLEREQIRSRLSSDLYADLFPDSSPLDRPVAELVAGPARGAPPGAATLAPVLQSPRGRNLDAGNSRGLDPVLDALLPSEAGGEEDESFALGSNDWVVDGAHTASGKPLLSNDPHLGHSVPSVWYMVHLEAPSLNVTGVSLPGGPGVIIGHNDRIAWGMTNTGPDVQDLYVETFNPSNPLEYLEDSRWIKATIRDEVIKVRGAPDDHLTVRTTRHGPVILEEGGRSLALRWTALEPHAVSFPFLAINEARNWGEFTQALRHFDGPEQNIVYADVDGNIGYYAPAWIPVRRNGDGTVPVPGDTDAYDWVGYIPFQDLPHAFNPPGGLIATANSRVVPADYPYLITRMWTAPFRTARIFQLLEAGTPDRTCAAGTEEKAACFNAADMLRIDMDIRPLDDVWLAGELVRAARAHPPDRDDARRAIAILGRWSGEATADSPAPLICRDTLIALRERLLEPKLGAELSRKNWPSSAVFIENVINRQLTRWLPPGDTDFNATLMGSLHEGLDRIERRLPGRAPGSWRWGDANLLTFHHPLDTLPALGRFFDVGPYPQAGTINTIRAAAPGYGASMRMVVDLSNLDGSLQNLTLGESGQISSPYYRDQFEAWYAGRSFPMLFSDQAVNRAAVHRLRLEPQSPSNRQ